MGARAVQLVGKQIPLRLAHAHDIVGLAKSAFEVRLPAVGLHARAQCPAAEVGQQGAVGRPDFNFAFLKGQELLLFVEEDESLRRREVLNQLLGVVPAVENFERAALGLDHNSLVKLLQELDFAAGLGDVDLHDGLAGVDVDQGHGHAVLLDGVEQEHHPVADLELRYLLVL